MFLPSVNCISSKMKNLMPLTCKSIYDSLAIIPCSATKRKPSVQGRGHVVRPFLASHEASCGKRLRVGTPVGVKLVGQLAIVLTRLEKLLQNGISMESLDHCNRSYKIDNACKAAKVVSIELKRN